LFSIGVLFWFHGCSGDGVVSGTVYRRDDSPAAGVAVRLIGIDDRGVEKAQLASAVTDASGRFHMEVGSDPGMAIAIESMDPAGPLRGFAAGRSGFRGAVHPLTDALVSAVTEITGPTGGKSLADFDPEAVSSVTDRLLDLDRSSLDLSDPDAVRTFVLANVGRAISEASGAVASARSSAGFDPAEAETVPSFATTTRCALSPVHEIVSSDFTFDLTADGKICDGYSPLARDAFDLAFELSVLNDTFTASGVNTFPSDEAAARLLDGRTLRGGPFALTSGVTVTRKVYIPETGNFARFLEILENPTGIDRTVDLQIAGNLGSDITTTLLAKGGSPEAVAATDRYAATCDTIEFDAVAGFVWQDNGGISVTGPQFVGAGNPDLFAWLWSAVSVPAGGTKTFLYYASLTRDRLAEVVGGRLLEMAEDPDMERMTAREIRSRRTGGMSRGRRVRLFPGRR
jgi:hypothetical protein